MRGNLGEPPGRPRLVSRKLGTRGPSALKTSICALRGVLTAITCASRPPARPPRLPPPLPAGPRTPPAESISSTGHPRPRLGPRAPAPRFPCRPAVDSLRNPLYHVPSGATGQREEGTDG